MMGFAGGRDTERDSGGRAAFAQRRRIARQTAFHDDSSDDEYDHHHGPTGGFIKRDLQFGLALAAMLAFLIVPRLLPNIAPSDASKQELPVPVNSTSAAKAVGESLTPPTMPVEAPLLEPPARTKQSPLTDVVPKGYTPPGKETAKSPPEKPIEKPSEKATEKSTDSKLGVPLLPPEKSTKDDISKPDPKTEGKREPIRNAARKSDVVTEFVPYEERSDSPSKVKKAPESDVPEPQAIAPPKSKPNEVEPNPKTKLVGLAGKGVKVQSFEKSANLAETGKSAKGPIHPFFQRYLEEKEYPVRYGDTLEVIAYRLYGDEKMSDAIAAANGDLLRENNSRLRSGMRLRLP